MSDFLSNLVARSLGTSDVIRPRTPSLYEPYRAGSGPHVAWIDPRSPEPEREPQDADVGITKPRAQSQGSAWRYDKQALPIPNAPPGDRVERTQTGEPGPAAISPREEARSEASPAAARAMEAKSASRLEANSSSVPTPEATAPPVGASRRSGDETGPLPSGSKAFVGRPGAPEGSEGDFHPSHLPAGEAITPAIALPVDATRAVRWAREAPRPTAATYSGMAKIPEPSPPLEDNKSTESLVLGSPQPSSETQSDPFASQLRSQEGAAPAVAVSGFVGKPASAVLENFAELEPDRPARRTDFPLQASGKIQLPVDPQDHSAGLSAGVVHAPVGSRSEVKTAGAARGSNRSGAAVEVTIGSVEVRAVFPEKPASRAPSTRPKPGVSLDDYLKRSGGGPR
jgi:hypothetical protein